MPAHHGALIVRPLVLGVARREERLKPNGNKKFQHSRRQRRCAAWTPW